MISEIPPGEKPDEILRGLGEEGSIGALRPFRDDSMRSFPDAKPFFLEPGNLSFYCGFCGLDSGARERVLKTARVILDNPPLARLAWHCYRLLFAHKDYNSFGEWPELRHALRDDCGVFYLIIALAMVPEVRKTHRALGIPERVTKDTCFQVRCFCSNYELARGRHGIFTRQLSWLRHYVDGRLFRLGRFEYMLKPFGSGITVFRSRRSGAVAALIGGGMEVTEEGYIDSAETKGKNGRGWITSYEENEEFARGYPVSPQGYVAREAVCLPEKEWEVVLRKGETVLDMHIPAGGGMTLEKCRESFSEAFAFFEKYFPERTFRAVTSSSWIFFNGLQDILGRDSNIARFQEELFLYPVPSARGAGLWFIFFDDDILSGKPALKTSLQRAVCRHIAGGGEWRSGGMLFMKEHLEHFGTGFYLKS